MSKKQQRKKREDVLTAVVVTFIVTMTFTFFITRMTQIDSSQVLTVNDFPFSMNNFLVDAETLSRELQQVGVNAHIDTINNNFVLIPRSVDNRHTTELMLWGNWLNANYGTAAHDLGGGGVIQQNDTMSFQFNHTNALGAYTFTRRVVDDRGLAYAELYSGTYWIDSNDVLHLHYRFHLDSEGEVIDLIDLHQQWLFEWVYHNALNIWQEGNPGEIMQLQRVGLPQED